MTLEEARHLRVLANATEPLLARAVAAKVHGCTIDEALADGRSVGSARLLVSLARRATEWVERDYPYGTTYVAYSITEAGREALSLQPA